MTIWGHIIAGVALAFSVACFFFFWKDAQRRANPQQAADRAAEVALEEGIPLQGVADLAKAFAEAFSKVGPGVLALIGSILFLLLAGEAAGVYNLTGGSAPDTSAQSTADPDSVADTNASTDADNASTEAGNASNGAEPANESGASNVIGT
jgi:hypothetical protein